MTTTCGGLASGFFRSAERFPDRPALDFGEVIVTYAALRERVVAIAQTLMEVSPSSDLPLTALLVHRSLSAYASVLAVLARGHGYVPLTPTVPAGRNVGILDRVACETLIVDRTGESQLPEILDGVMRPLVILMVDRTDVSQEAKRWPKHRFVTVARTNTSSSFVPVDPAPDAIAYLIFTSGSTGTPKGVMVSHANIGHFLNVVQSWYDVSCEDRLTQMFELVFDLSLFDLFVTWGAGACLCCPSSTDLLMPAAFIRSTRPSIWFSVPSTAWLMGQQRSLAADEFPSLRLSLFCGEALPMETVRRWSLAAPNGRIENLYGPTELTVACSRYCCRGDMTDEDDSLGIVPIGKMFPGLSALIANAEGEQVPFGEEGELLVAGPQVSLGYFASPEQTKRAFVTPPGRTDVYYRTGDRVRQKGPDAPIAYVGRVDDQIKIRGNRVELGEVEAALRAVTGIQGVAAVGWPLSASGANGVVAFIHATDLDPADVRRQLKSRLPRYMLPSEIHVVDRWPVTTSGKVDRATLVRSYLSSQTDIPTKERALHAHDA